MRLTLFRIEKISTPRRRATREGLKLEETPERELEAGGYLFEGNDRGFLGRFAFEILQVFSADPRPVGKFVLGELLLGSQFSDPLPQLMTDILTHAGIIRYPILS